MTNRLQPLDALRGFIIVAMALDHANLFIAHQHSSGEFWGGPFPTYTSNLGFLTRFATHVAAPGFFFLMGAGMLLFTLSRREKGWSAWRIAGHFLLRGSILIALQFLLENRAWALSLSNAPAYPPGQPSGPNFTYYGVLYALGGAMILGILLLHLKPRRLLEITLILAIGLELLIPEPAMVREAFPQIARLLLIPGFSGDILVYYPILPWMKLLAFGMLFAYWLRDDAKRAYRLGLRLGIIFLALFMVLRLAGGFGNLQAAPGNGWADLLNVVKYPPSLTFSLLTMGINLIILYAFYRLYEARQKWLSPLMVFGRVPLFFYIAHLFLYAGIGLWIGPGGTSLPEMYPYWLLGLLFLLPLSWLYGRARRSKAGNLVLRFL
ncbi:MAG: DUF1624 domain-containing protein [Chloroflexi bacterium]|nr:MAG: DUF1624 domain-containing protein [Chloroflexota bacterium]MBL1195722.1 DUF1624 domain-containing protein [Chloroflexota bacterium]NOH13010.1 DUF1624 domain-containing protein [Chloroflexota bacterium]